MTILTVDLSPPATNKSTVIQVWVNASFDNQSVSNLSGQLIYDCCTEIEFTTDENGTAVIELNVGNSIDDSSTFDDLASNGILILVTDSEQLSIASVTLYGSVLGEQVRDAGGLRQWVPLEVSAHNAAIISSVIRW